MANFASLRGPVGMNRVFVRSGAPLEQHRWLAALQAGHSFATNGPLLDFRLEGKGIGDELTLPAAGRELTARVTLRSIVPVDHLEIVRNGEVIAELPLSGDRTSASVTIRLPAESSGWYLLRARGDRTAYPVLDVYPYATTSPIYVLVGARPIRSAVDAQYFLAWIARLEAAARAHTGWNSEAEKTQVLVTMRQARAEFERRDTQ
jgi:TolB protein